MIFNKNIFKKADLAKIKFLISKKKKINSMNFNFKFKLFSSSVENE